MSGASDSVRLKGFAIAELYDGVTGKLKARHRADNVVCNALVNDFLNVYWRDTTQTATWYMGVIDNAGYTTNAATDTMASHSGWTEFASYSNSTRPAWSPGAASSQAIVNGTQVSFTLTAGGTLRGIFITSDNTKSGTAGLLCSTAPFNEGPQTVNNGDVLKVTYTMTGTPS